MYIIGFRTTLLVQQKSLLDEAILNDTEFLSKCNVMDYSLLVGIDQEKREITIGIVGKAQQKSLCKHTNSN
jgi:hypothetical protein